MPNHFTLTFFLLRRRDVSCSHSNRDLFTCEDNMLFSHVKISCFRAKAHLVFHWYLYNKSKYCHITPLLVDLHWLLVKFRIEFKILLIGFKIFKGLAPSYLRSLITRKPVYLDIT